MHKLLRISLSAALISARLAGSASAAYLPEDFDQIQTYVDSGNWVGLRTYIEDNPRLLEGDDAFALELRRFAESVSGLYAALTFEPAQFPNLALGDQIRTTLPEDTPLAAIEPDDDPSSADIEGAAQARSTAPVERAGPAVSRAAAAPTIY